MGEDNEHRTGEGFFIFSFIALIHISLAPNDFRKELVDYSLKFYGITILAGLAFFIIRSEMQDRKRKKEIEEAERIQNLARERARRDAENKRGE